MQLERAMIDYIFWTGVELLKLAASATGFTYQEINVWLFVIAHPILTIVIFLLYLHARFVR
jgi:hypothetical protein